MSDNSDHRFRVRLSGRLGAKLNAYVERTGLEANDVFVAAVGEYLDAVNARCGHCGAATSEPWAKLGQGVGQNGPGSGPKWPSDANDTKQTALEPPKRAKPKILPTDTDEIIAVLTEIEAIPDADPNDLDLTTTYALRKAEIARRVAALRAAQPCNRPQVAENAPLTARPVPET